MFINVDKKHNIMYNKADNNTKGGSVNMASNSILKNVNITDKHLGRSFVVALEQAQNKTSAEVEISRTVSEIRGEKIKELFGKK